MAVVIKTDRRPTKKAAASDHDARVACRLAQPLVSTIQNTKSALGKISGQVVLKGHGNSVAQMLGSASGEVVMLMGKGEISNILLEFLGLDGGEIIKFLVRGDRHVQLLCAAAAWRLRSVSSSRCWRCSQPLKPATVRMLTARVRWPSLQKHPALQPNPGPSQQLSDRLLLLVDQRG
jgi:hypothetical protein